MRRTFAFLFLIWAFSGCLFQKGNRGKVSSTYKSVFTGDSTLTDGEWIEVSYRQSKSYQDNLISVYHQDQWLTFENYLTVMGSQMTYPLYLQKIQKEGNVIYTVRKGMDGAINMSMSEGTINRTYSELARWIMPIRYGKATSSFGVQDSISIRIQFKRKAG